MGGWELNLTAEDLSAFPKNSLSFNAVITGKRGFNEIKSPVFVLPAPGSTGWEIETQAQNSSAPSDKKTIKLKNNLGGCRCLRAVVLLTASGQKVNFEADSKEHVLQFSPNGTEVSLEVDASSLLTGQATLELRTQGGGVTSLPVNLPRAAAPSITDFKLLKGANHGTITGENLELLQFVRVNGLKASVVEAKATDANSDQKQLAALNSNQRTIVFENPNVGILSESVSLTLGFKNGQTSLYPQQFKITLKN